LESLLFVLKKLLSRLLFPLGLVLSLGAAGMLVWLINPRRRLGPALVISAGLLLWAFSAPWVAGGLLAPLERMAGPYAQPQELEKLGVSQIVVLSGSQRSPSLTPADRCGNSTALRVLEGVRLWKQMPGATLVLAGGSFFEREPAAKAMSALAAELGVSQTAMRLETGSWDTGDQAQVLAAKLGKAPFALVTSASHMPRAILIFRAQGLHPLPAPCDFHTAGKPPFSLMDLLPQAHGLALSERAAYEYLGMLFYEIRSLLGLAKTDSGAPRLSAPERENQ
jgi:uncharacterized SAM-binding protein YcdF (DUF218 family)